MEKFNRQTERTLAATTGIDIWDDQKILAVLLAGQERAIAAVRGALPAIGKAAAVLSERLQAGGRLVYAGAGTSIRIAVQDGSELPATFGMAEDRLLYLVAGGREAMFETLASAEDDADAGERDALICNAADTLVAVAASGTTPYTLAAARRARTLGTYVIAVVNNADSQLGAAADLEILLDSGPEVIAGSTRMAAGTAQKAALNLLSTLTHIRLGAVHDGYMVNVRAENSKLKLRARDIVMAIAGTDPARATAALAATDGHVKEAILICAGATSYAAAQDLLTAVNGKLRLALARLTGP
jgi:N-acetylmuramic acid 6-phosphate etherase